MPAELRQSTMNPSSVNTFTMYAVMVFAASVLLQFQLGQAKLPPANLSHYGTALFRTIDPSVDQLIRTLDRSSGVQPWELGNLVESDMRLPVPKLRNGLIGDSTSFFRWPNATLVYKMVGNFNKTERHFIQMAMREFERYTCIRFKERTNEASYAAIGNHDYGCWADVGRGHGKTIVNLQAGCATALTTPIHELMHALGFFHEHTRLDRDEYIDVIYDHMIPDPSIYYNFQLVEPSEASNFSVPYDIGSIMHYSRYSFSVKPGKLETMVAKVPWNGTFGQGETLTKYDALLLNIVYCGAPAPKEPLPVPDRWIPAEPLVKESVTTERPKRTTTTKKPFQRSAKFRKMNRSAKQKMEQELWAKLKG